MEPVSDLKRATDIKQKGSISFLLGLISQDSKTLALCGNVFYSPGIFSALEISKKLYHRKATVDWEKKKVRVGGL